MWTSHRPWTLLKMTSSPNPRNLLRHYINGLNSRSEIYLRDHMDETSR
jgi:hypothetical protein